MSECIQIQNLEHLVQEQTLLINYNILCSGLWNLSQLQTAYRGVCDESWIVMYPNHQHPRHTDFPISVGAGGASCSFAWNYGGIPSVSAENFDSNHSYLVQLTIYNLQCGLTGQPGTSGSTIEPTVILEPFRVPPTGGGPTIVVRPGGVFPPFPGSPGGPSNPQPTPAPPAPPFPGPGGPGGGGGGAGGGVWIPTNPVSPAPRGPVITPTGPVGPRREEDPIIDPTDPVGPRGENPGGGQQPRGPKTPRLPYEPWEPPPSSRQAEWRTKLPASSWEPPAVQQRDGRTKQPLSQWNGEMLMSTSSPVVNIMTTQVASTQYQQIVRENLAPGQSPESRISQSIGMQSQAIGGYTEASTLGSPSPDLRQGGANMAFASVPGSQNSVLIGGLKPEDIGGTDQVTKLDTSSVMPGSITMLELSSQEVKKGEPVTISGVFLIPSGVELVGSYSLYLIDTSKRTSLLYLNPSFTTTSTSPGKAAITISTGQIPVGSSTVVFVARGYDGKVIGVASKQLIVRPLLSALANQSLVQNGSQDFGLSPSLRRIANLSDDYLKFDFLDNTAHRWILTRTNSSLSTLSALVSCDTYSPSDRFSIAAYETIASFGGLPSRGDIYGMTPIIQTSDKIRQDGYVYDPYAYNAGFMNVATASTVILEVVPMQTSFNDMVKDGRVYLSYNYQPRPITVTGSTADTVTSSEQLVTVTITGTFPFIGQELGLYVNGRSQEYIPSNYSIHRAITDSNGSCTWTGVVARADDFFSIVKPTSKTYNPYKNLVFAGQLTLFRGMGGVVSVTQTDPLTPPGLPNPSGPSNTNPLGLQ